MEEVMSWKKIEGLPEADDYQPETIGTAELRAGEPEQTWPQYGLELVPIEHRARGDWTDTGRRLIRRNGEIVKDVSERYKLLPNERAVKAANEAARELGAIPFDEWGDPDLDWYATLDDHIFQDADRYRVHALYAWDDPVYIAGDQIQFGFAVHNSIDKSLSFQVALFSYRHACSNMVEMTVRQGSQFANRALDVESERAVLAHGSRAHTSGLAVDVDELKTTIKQILTVVDAFEDPGESTIAQRYREWNQTIIQPEMVDDVLDRALGSGDLAVDDLPAWMQAIAEDIKAAQPAADDEEEESLPWEHRAEFIAAELPEATAIWDTYNDITEAIWHNNETNDLSKRRKTTDLHRVMQPAPGVA